MFFTYAIAHSYIATVITLIMKDKFSSLSRMRPCPQNCSSPLFQSAQNPAASLQSQARIRNLLSGPINPPEVGQRRTGHLWLCICFLCLFSVFKITEHSWSAENVLTLIFKNYTAPSCWGQIFLLWFNSCCILAPPSPSLSLSLAPSLSRLLCLSLSHFFFPFLHSSLS